MAAVVLEALTDHSLRSKRTEGLVLGRTAELPFVPSTVRAHALRAWKAETDRIKKADPTKGGLAPIGLHEARHSFTFTLDQYAKVFARHERVMVDRFDAYLAGHATLKSEKEAS